jgi:hypothetical protein
MPDYDPIKVGAGGDTGAAGGAKINTAIQYLWGKAADLPATAADPKSTDFSKFGLLSYAALWAEISATNVMRNAATPVLDFHALMGGKAGLIGFGDKQALANGPNGIATGATGLVTITGSMTEGLLMAFIEVGPASALGFWSKRVSNSVWGEWIPYSVDAWQDVMTGPFQASPGYRIRVADGVAVKLATAASQVIIGIRIIPKTTWDKVPAIITTESGWTVQAHPTAGSAEVVYVPDFAAKVWEMKGGSGAQAATADPNAIPQANPAPIPSVTTWQITNATVGSLITYTAVRAIESVSFNYTDPEDDTATSVFSLSDMTTGFNASGFYGGDTKFTNLTMPNGKPVRIILVKQPGNGLGIVVAKPASTLTVFGKIANVQLAAVPLPAPVVPVTQIGRSIPTASGVAIVEQGTELTLGGLQFRVSGSSLGAMNVQVRSSGVATTINYHGGEARFTPSVTQSLIGAVGLAVNDNAGAWVSLGAQNIGFEEAHTFDVWTDSEAFMVRAYQQRRRGCASWRA